MRITCFLVASVLVLTACDETRYFEKNKDFKQRYWLTDDRPAFDFEINEPEKTYNLYLTVRNESSYPNSNLYFTYYLTDSTGNEIQKKLISEFLFDKKTGKPLGSSGLGDIYDHRFMLLKAYSFPASGKYTMRYEQFMRTDTLRGIYSIGLRIEKAESQ